MTATPDWLPSTIANALAEAHVLEHATEDRYELAHKLHGEGLTREDFLLIEAKVEAKGGDAGLITRILRGDWKRDIAYERRRAQRAAEDLEAVAAARLRYDPSSIQSKRVEQYRACGRSELTFEQAAAQLRDRDVLEKVTMDHWTPERAAGWFGFPGTAGVEAAIARARAVENAPTKGDGLPAFASILPRRSDSARRITLTRVG